MKDDPSDRAARRRVERAESVWFEAVAGRGPADRDALCAAHPEIAAELRVVAADWEWLEGAVKPDGLDAFASMENAGGLDEARYTRIETVAEGGGGRIERIWDALLERGLAMKVARFRAAPGRGARSRSLARFLREARVMGQLQHPGIVALHDVGIDGDGFAFFTMDLVEGIDLGEAFALARRESGGWSTQRAVRAVASVAETLAYAHDRGVLHRDIKPANVRVGPFGEVYVMDWGLARLVGEDPDCGDARDGGDHADGEPRRSAAEELTVDGAVMGTPAYMAPEQARGAHSELDPRTDVYAMGAMLYELLAGVPPYEAGRYSTPEDAAHAVARAAPEGLATKAPHAPAELVAITERAMARRRDDRYADMSAMARDLRAFLDGRVVDAHRTGALVEIEKWVRRNRLSAAAIGLFVAALAAAAGIQQLSARDLRRANSSLVDANEALASAHAKAESEAYLARIAAAQASLRAGNGRSAAVHLESCAPEQRGWAWDHLWCRASNAERTFALRPTMAAPGEFDRSADGSRAALVHIRFPKLEHGVESVTELIVHDLEGATERVLPLRLGGTVVRFVPDTSELMLATRSGLEVHDLAREGPPVRSIDLPVGETELVLLALSSDGRLLAHVAQGARVDVRRTSDLSLVRSWRPTGGRRPLVGLAVSPDGDTVSALASDGRLHVLDVAGGSATHVALPPFDQAAYAPPLESCPSTGLVAMGASSGTVSLVRPGEPNSVRELQVFDGPITAMSFDPSGRWLACGGMSGALSVRDVQSGAEVLRGYGHQGVILAVGWEAAGVELWSASRDGSLRSWRLDRGPGVDEPTFSESFVRGTFCDARRERFATLHADPSLLLWDARAGRVLARRDALPSGGFVPTSGAFVPTTGDLVVGQHFGGVVRLGAEDLSVKASNSAVAGSVSSIDDRGRRVTVHGNDGVQILDVEDLTVEATLDDVDPLAHVVFTEGGGAVWVGDVSGTLRRLSIDDGVLEHTVALAEPTAISGLAIDGRHLAVGLADGRLQLRSAVDGALVADLGVGSGPVEQLAFHPEEALLLSSGRSLSGEETLRFWDTDQARLRSEVMGPTGPLREAAFVAHGARIVARSAGGSGFAILDRAPAYRGLLCGGHAPPPERARSSNE